MHYKTPAALLSLYLYLNALSLSHPPGTLSLSQHSLSLPKLIISPVSLSTFTSFLTLFLRELAKDVPHLTSYSVTGNEARLVVHSPILIIISVETGILGCLEILEEKILEFGKFLE